MKIALPLALLAATASANNDGHKHCAAAETMRKAFLHRIQLDANNGTVSKSIFTDNKDITVKFTCVSAQAYPALVSTVVSVTGSGQPSTLLNVPPLGTNQQAVAIIHVTLNNPANFALLANFGFGNGVAPLSPTNNPVPREVVVSINQGQNSNFIGENFGTSLYKLDGTRYISFQPYSAWTHVVPGTTECFFGARIEYTRRKNNQYAAADAEQIEEEGDDDYSDELEAISDDN